MSSGLIGVPGEPVSSDDWDCEEESSCREFRELYENIRGTESYCQKKVAVLNCWGKMRYWGRHMVHHALCQRQNYSYAGVIEALSGRLLMWYLSPSTISGQTQACWRTSTC